MSNQPKIIQGSISAQADTAKASNVRRGPLVEDTSVVGGVDRVTGAPVIRPKTQDGKGDMMTETTDPREQQ